MIGKQLAALRREKGFSQTQMAAELGKPFSKSDISNLENGRSPTGKRLAIYAAYFGLRLETVAVEATVHRD